MISVLFTAATGTIVGNLTDCEKLLALAQDGAVILGASSARYAYEIQQFLAVPEEERGKIVQVFGTAGVDEFNYGVHIAEALAGILGSGFTSVRFMGRGQAGGKYAETYYLQHASGASAAFNTFTGTWQPFVITIMTTKTTFHFQIDSSRLYAALVEQICNFMEGKPHLLVSCGDLVESIRVMLAAAASRAADGAAVSLDELRPDGPSYDGSAFWAEYKAASGPMYAQ